MSTAGHTVNNQEYYYSSTIIPKLPTNHNNTTCRLLRILFSRSSAINKNDQWIGLPAVCCILVSKLDGRQQPVQQKNMEDHADYKLYHRLLPCWRVYAAAPKIYTGRNNNSRASLPYTHTRMVQGERTYDDTTSRYNGSNPAVQQQQQQQ